MPKTQLTAEGRGSLKRLPEMMKKLKIRNPLIVGIPPLPERLTGEVPSLSNAPLFSAFHANPDLRDTLAGAALFREAGCDGLIAVGGGSSIDTAKGIRALLATASAAPTASAPTSSAAPTASASTSSVPSALEEALFRVARRLLPDRLPVPEIAIPGTAGTGSEATQFAVVYDGGKKISLDHPDLLPEGVILDAALLDTLPMYHKKSCALDALAQGIESYWSRGATEESRVHAYLAILGVLDNLKAYLAGDPKAAEEMLHAAFQSGKAIQITRTTAAHAMSYQLTKTMGLAHGHAVMVTLPVLWEMMLPREEMKETLSSLSRLMRLGDPMMGPRLLWGILLDLEMPIPENPGEERLEELAASVNAERLGNHPVPLSREDVKAAYRKAFLPLPEAERRLCLDLWRYYGK